MRANKPRRRPGSIRYLLSLDRTLQRASLRKLVERVKPARRSTRVRAASKGAKASTPRSSPARHAWSIDPWTMVFAAVGVVTVAFLIAARPPSGEARAASVDAGEQVDRAEPVLTAVAGEPVAPVAPSEQPPQRVVLSAGVASDAHAAPESRRAPSVAEAPARKPSASEVTPRPPQEPLPAAPVEARVASSPIAQEVEELPEPPVTVTGCLESTDDTFWLKDTAGDGAPKGRSWRSGFLRKRPARVEVIDQAHVFGLAAHVGQRLETTGVLAGRELRIRSLRVQGSCD